MNDEVRRVDLHLPRGWNQCTTGELEVIAAAVAMETARAGRYHAFDMAAVKVSVLLGINHLEMVAHGGDGCLVRFGDKKSSLIGRIFRKKEEPFLLPVSHIHAMVTQYLGWLDDEKSDPLMRFPYPEISVKGRKYIGPPPMMDGYSWEDYRHLQDWMSEYLRRQNEVAKAAEPSGEPSGTVAAGAAAMAVADAMAKAMAAMDKARAEFLAVLLKRAADTPPRQEEEAAADFRDFNPVRWQVILFWWSGAMRVLARKFPKVFKEQPVEKQQRKPSRRQRQSPWDFYNQVTATLAKEYKTSEDEQRRETYSVTLQKLERMAEEAEALERSRGKR